MSILPVKLAVPLLIAFFSTAIIARPAKSLDEWKGFAQSETLDVFLKDRIVGTLFHSFTYIDSLRALRVESSMSVLGGADTSTGVLSGAAIDLFEQRVYGRDGSLISAYQRLSGKSGTNEWKLEKTVKGWLLAITAGGIASSVSIASVKENILPTLLLLKSIRTSKCRAGNTFVDTAFELVSQQNIATVYRCTAVSADRGQWTFDMVDNMAGRPQAWVLDGQGRTLSQEIEGVFVARVAEKRGNGTQTPQNTTVALSELAEVFCVKKDRPPQSGERISLRIPAGMSLDSSVSPFYEKSGDRLLCADFPQRCVSPDGTDDTSLSGSAWTRPTVTIQSDYPAIIALAARLKAGRKNRCGIIDTCNRYVYGSLVKRNTATFSNAVETLKAGYGDCGEHAVLLAAILRAAGIPARVILGLLYYTPKKAFVGHAWVAAYAGAGTWIFCDPAFGVFPAARDRVPLIIDDNGAHALLLTKYIGRIGIDYVKR
jgi:transglutaminase-like putative cysteine protease